MLGPETVLERVVSAFGQCLSDTEVLRTIDEFFSDLDYDFDAEAEEASVGRGVAQRRSRAAGYLATLDLEDPADRDRLLQTIAAKMSEWTDGRGPSADRLQRLNRTLRNAGYEWDGHDIAQRAGGVVKVGPAESATCSRTGAGTRPRSCDWFRSRDRAKVGSAVGLHQLRA